MFFWMHLSYFNLQYIGAIALIWFLNLEFKKVKIHSPNQVTDAYMALRLFTLNR